MRPSLPSSPDREPYPIRIPLLAFTALAILLAMLASVSPTLQAGFDHPRNVNVSNLWYNGAPIGPHNAPVSQETLTNLMNRFPGSTALQITNKVIAYRTNLQNMINLIRMENRTIGDCLQRIYNCGRMCVDFRGTNANASIITDGRTNCVKEPINIGFNNLPCTQVPIYSSDTYQLLSSLFHEGRHAVQDYGASTNGTPFQFRVRLRRQNACNEIEAENTENGLIENLKPALTNIVNQATNLPPATTNAARTIAEAILNDPNLTPLQRRLAASNLLVEVCNIKRFNDEHIRCREQQKMAFDMFLTNAITRSNMNARIQQTRWYATYNFTNGSYGVVRDPLYYGGGGSGIFNQSSAGRVDSWPTGLQAAHDMHLLDQGRKMVIVGHTEEGQGALVGFQDRNGDRLFEPSSAQPLMVGPELFGGVDLVLDPATGQLVAFNPATGEIIRLVDTTGDGFPDQPQFAGAVDPDADDSLLSIDISADGEVLYAFSDYNVDQGRALLPEMDVTLAFNVFEGFFEVAGPERIFDQLVHIPAFINDVGAGDNQLFIHATPFTDVVIQQVDDVGNPFQFVGQQQTDHNGFAVVPTFNLLIEGSLIQAFSDQDGLASTVQTVGPSSLRLVDPQYDPTGRFIFFVEGNYEGPVIIEATTDFNYWEPIDFLPLQNGRSLYHDDDAEDFPMRFYKATIGELY